MDTSFKRFTSLLLEWNRVHNLTGAKRAKDIELNIQDSLYPCSFIDEPKSILDIGSGAGFPALILAIAYPKAKVVLCEPRNKRASFLKFVSLELGLKNTIVVKKRVEDYSTNMEFDLITSRAVTNTKILLNLTKHLRNSDTKYLFYKGERLFNELEDINSSMDYDIISKNRRNYLYIKRINSAV